MANRIEGDIVFAGSATFNSLNPPNACITDRNIAAGAEIDRDKLELNPLAPYGLRLTDWRVWDAMQTVLPGTAAADDLALITGTFGTAAPTIRTSDAKNTTATQRARFEVILPAEYVDGETVVLRLLGGMVTTVASSSATVDVEAYEVSKSDGTIGSDLCATAAQSINSLTPANKDFTITPSGLAAGDKLDVRVTIAITDSATATAVIGTIYQADLLCDIRG